MRRFVLFTTAAIALLFVLSLQAMSSSLVAAPATVIATVPATTTPTPQTTTVTNLNDSGPGSLRQAITDAQGGAVISFASSVRGSLTLSKGVDIGKDITIQGPSTKASDLIIIGSNSIEAFGVRGPVHVRFANLSITSGSQSLTRGITNQLGTVIINNVVFFGLSSQDGGAIVNVEGTVTAIDCVFRSNQAGSGGAVSSSGTLLIKNSAFQANVGGAVDSRGTLTVINSTFQGNNFTEYGAAIYNSGNATILNSTFWNNTGKAGSVTGELKGGAIANGAKASANITLQNSIVGGDLGGTNCLQDYGSLVADSSDLQYPGIDCGETVLKGDPKLAALTDNGGLTPTMRLLPGSAAMGRGNKQICASIGDIDQRGAILPPNFSCDIGAFQVNAVLPVATPVATQQP